MNDLQNLSESDRRWYDLIHQCRTSGKSDRQWLMENDISAPTFYYHVKQLRKKACEIPANTFFGVAEKQEVVPLIIDDLHLPVNHSSASESHFNSDGIAVRLTIRNVTVEITNQATQSVIKNTVSALQHLC